MRRRSISLRAVGRRRWKFRVPLVLAVAVLLVAPQAGAKLCGDNVGGRDVPCACGDTVVSDVTLGDDPVVDAVCPADGLIVRAPSSRWG